MILDEEVLKVYKFTDRNIEALLYIDQHPKLTTSQFEKGANIKCTQRKQLFRKFRGVSVKMGYVLVYYQDTPTSEYKWEIKHYDGVDEDIISSNVKLAKQKQKAQDQNRIANKAFREFSRVENAIEEIHTQLLEVLKEKQFKNTTKKHKEVKTDYEGIIQLSDFHLNELIDIQDNSYDMDIASKRLKKYANRVKAIFKSHGVKKVLVAMTGDMINSDRRLDEKLSMASNRATATVVAIDLIQQFLHDMNKDFNLTVASVCGNESRLDPEMTYSQIGASDNYDMIIHNYLGLLFKNSKGIDFIYGDDCLESVVKVKNKNILLKHGTTIRANGLDKKIAEIKGKISDRGIRIDYVLFGHIHCTRISDTYARSSSLSGGNGYSSQALELSSRASQNCYIISDDSIDAVKICLQNVGNEQGYDMDEISDRHKIKGVQQYAKKIEIHQI